MMTEIFINPQYVGRNPALREEKSGSVRFTLTTPSGHEAKVKYHIHLRGMKANEEDITGV